MSIVNRRNAMIGWATWTVAQQGAAHQARSAAGVEQGKARRRLIIPLLAAAGASLFFGRRKGDDGAPPDAE